MEPVSLLIGIMPLCAQLAKTTTTINNLISTYKSAARELEALSSTLADVANVCESLGDILYTTDTSNYHPSEARLFAALHGRIQECHDRLADIQDIIQVVNGKRRGPFRNDGFLFLQFKDKISSCTRKLEKSLSSLNLVLTTSNFIRLLQPPRMEVTILGETNLPSQPSAVIAPGRASSSGYIDTSPISTDVSRKSIPETTCVMNRWQQSLLGLAFIAKTTMQKKTASVHGLVSSIIEDYSTFTVGSPFSSRSIKISVKQDFLAPLYITLQVPCVIPVYHGSSSLGDRILNAYTNDDPQEIRQLLEQRSVTTTTLLGWYDHYDTGYTILGVSHQHGLDLPFIDIRLVSSSINSTTNSSICEVTNDFGGGKHFPDHSGLFKFMFETSDLLCAVDYVNMRKDGMGPDELDSLLTGVLTCSQLKACIDAYLTWSSPARGRFYKVLGRSVLRAFSKQHLLEHDVEDWASFISEHAARGLDIYSDLHTDLLYDASTLTAILRHPNCPDVAISNLHLWLDVLELAGVKIAQYLEIETPRCFATWGASAAWHMPGYREEGSLINRVLQVQYSRGRLIPYWREEVDRACYIRELLVEFPRFLHRETIDTYANWMDTMRLRQAWKAGENTTLIHPEKTTWPVAPRMGDDRRPPDLKHQTDRSTEVKRTVEWLYREYHQRKKRHERKLERKIRKGAGNRKAHGKMSMPGTWVD